MAMSERDDQPDLKEIASIFPLSRNIRLLESHGGVVLLQFYLLIRTGDASDKILPRGLLENAGFPYPECALPSAFVESYMNKNYGPRREAWHRLARAFLKITDPESNVSRDPGL